MKHLISMVVSLCVVMLAASAQTTRKPSAKPELLHADAVENFFKLTENVYSGSTPETEAAFADLQKHGIKTIVSVDGAKPEVETAKKYGLRYVHLPIGYDGVSTNRVAELVKVGTSCPGPVYLHCHHGKHRGPAAAAMVCMGANGWTTEEGLQWLKQAGTATNYAGLYQSVKDFKAPSKDALAGVPAHLPERMGVSPLVDAMVEIDERFEHLQLVKAAGYKQPPTHPDIDPAHEALLLNELFREMRRSPDSKSRDDRYQAKLTEAEEITGQFHRALLPADYSPEKAKVLFQKITDNCAACHKAYRN